MDAQAIATNQPAAATGTRIRGLDGLRGVAAVMLLIYHAWGHSEFPKLVTAVGSYKLDLTGYVQFSGQGVTILFVLSGFLLSLRFWRELQGGPVVRLGSFFRRRFLRIYPAYLIVVLFLALVYDVAHPVMARVIMVASHLLFLHNLTEATIYSISAPLWYVATAFQLYVAIPLIFLILRKQLARGTALLPLVLGLFVLSGTAGILFFWMANAFLAHVRVDARLVVAGGRVLLHSPMMCLGTFCTGLVAGYLYIVLSRANWDHRGRSLWREIALYALVLVLPSLSQMTFHYVSGWSPRGWPIVPLLLAVLVFGISQSGHPWGLAAILDSAPLRLLGKVSYSFYLWHDFVLGTIWHSWSGASTGLLGSNMAKTACALVMTSVVAWLSYELLELRFGRIIARLWDRASERIVALRRKGA